MGGASAGCGATAGGEAIRAPSQRPRTWIVARVYGFAPSGSNASVSPRMARRRGLGAADEDAAAEGLRIGEERVDLAERDAVETAHQRGAAGAGAGDDVEEAVVVAVHERDARAPSVG